tara:strand:+ start:389 stop:3715 length:3327 start_codon:yes stop_codon:yes gene_type:complete
MAIFRSFSEIVSTMIQRLRLTQPNLDTKPGTVSRDLFVDIPADQIARLYSAINLVSEKQSLATTSGRDLDKLAANFGISRSTGSAATGIVVFCTNSIVADIPIPSGTLVTARNGATYNTVGNFVMSPSDKSRLEANANRVGKSLGIAGINARYVIEVPVQAVRPGTTGNVSTLQVVSTNLDGPVSVTNLTSMTGGAGSETDNSFRSRILSVFSGANIGTSAGYRNALIGVDGVADALVVEPGSSLMLRDGSETIELDNGDNRVINSGTGGKVDAYILGRKIQEVNESFIFTDLSGVGDASDERNDHVLGQVGQDLTRTSEERRVLAFSSGSVPAQPVDSIVSVSGSSSGLLEEQYTDDLGNVRGNYILEKDMNPETGGSPFGFDKIRFISNVKEVDSESVSKRELFGIDPLVFNEVDYIKQVYTDINESGENSRVSEAGSNYIRLLHYPVVKVSKVVNKTTGEIYSVTSQNLGPSGLNDDGVIEISGRSLPSSADILSVDYVWRHIFDPNSDYAGNKNVGQFFDNKSVDAIDWSSPGGVFEEESLISLSDDSLVYEVSLSNKINRPISVYLKTISATQVLEVGKVGNTALVGAVLSPEESSIDNIISVKRSSDGLELYKTEAGDESFEARTIYFPSDSQCSIGDEITVEYNKVELFDMDGGDGSFYGSKITLPSKSFLDSVDLYKKVQEAYFAGDSVFATYVSDSSVIIPETDLAGLPVVSIDASNRLVGGDIIDPELSNQPVFYTFNDSGERASIQRDGAAMIAVSAQGIPSPGKVKIEGETLDRLLLEVTVGLSFSGLSIDLSSYLKEYYGKTTLPKDMGIAKINRVVKLNSSGEVEHEFNVFGAALKNINYSIGASKLNLDLSDFKVTLPETPKNSSISLSSSDKVLLDVVVYKEDDFEEVYFSTPARKISTKRFGRVSRVSVSSGFRSAAGGLSGRVALDAFTQPSIGNRYFVDYAFLAPKEGERITVSYNVNKLIVDATSEVERVRPITADILIKEAEELLVDVSGTILINDDALSESSRIVESVINSVTNILSTSRLGATIDYSDIISAAATQNGVDSVNVSLFNENGKTGRKAFVKSLDNQTISPGKVEFEAVSRSKFRIN